MAADDKVTFELKDGFNRVEIAVQESDKNLVMETAPYTTADPGEIALLDANPGVKRQTKADTTTAKSDGGSK